MIVLACMIMNAYMTWWWHNISIHVINYLSSLAKISINICCHGKIKVKVQIGIRSIFNHLLIFIAPCDNTTLTLWSYLHLGCKASIELLHYVSFMITMNHTPILFIYLIHPCFYGCTFPHIICICLQFNFYFVRIIQNTLFILQRLFATQYY